MKLFKNKQFIAVSVAFLSVVFYYQFIATAAPNANILRNVLPETDVMYDLGTSTKRWNSISTNNITISGTCTGCGGSSSGGGLATSTTGQYTAGNLFFVANSSTASASDNLRYTTSTGAFAITATSTFTGQLNFGSASGTNLSLTGYGIIPTLNFTNGSGSNITASGYGTFPTLNFTNASGSNISGSGFVNFASGIFTNVSSTNYSASGYGLFPTLNFTNSSGTNSSVSGYGLFPLLAYTSATGTTLFNTTASSTNLGFTNATGTRLSVGNVTSTILTISGITGSTQCLRVDTNGLVSGTGSACGTGNISGNGTSSNIAFFSDQSTLTSHDNFRIVTSTMTLKLISKGVSNLFIGNDAGILQTTGESNTFIGDVAGASNATGSFNTAIGNGALGNLGSVGSGDSNIGIGYTSGFGVTSGTLNIFLGNGSGLSGGVASNNILIGHNTDISSGVNNAIAIGNGITVNTSNTGAIGGTGFKLGIGTQQPSSTLHVVGSLQIPTNQTLSLGGQVSVKTTSSTFNYHNGTNEFALNPVQCSNSAFTIANVTSTSSQYDFWHPVATSTITRLTARNGNASGTMDFNIIWHANGSTASSSQSHLFNGSGQVGNVTSSATTSLDIFPSLVSFASTTVKANDVVQIITGPRASSTQWTFGICWKEIP
jgi:hypothetical protein